MRQPGMHATSVLERSRESSDHACRSSHGGGRQPRAVRVALRQVSHIAAGHLVVRQVDCAGVGRALGAGMSARPAGSAAGRRASPRRRGAAVSFALCTPRPPCRRRNPQPGPPGLPSSSRTTTLSGPMVSTTPCPQGVPGHGAGREAQHGTAQHSTARTAEQSAAQRSGAIAAAARQTSAPRRRARSPSPPASRGPAAGPGRR